MDKRAENERYVAILTTVAKKSHPNHSVDLTRDADGLIGKKEANSVQRRLTLIGAMPEDTITVRTPFRPGLSDEFIVEHFKNELGLFTMRP